MGSKAAKKQKKDELTLASVQTSKLNHMANMYRSQDRMAIAIERKSRVSNLMKMAQFYQSVGEVDKAKELVDQMYSEEKAEQAAQKAAATAAAAAAAATVPQNITVGNGTPATGNSQDPPCLEDLSAMGIHDTYHGGEEESASGVAQV
jgi:hypothetical protein